MLKASIEQLNYLCNENLIERIEVTKVMSLKDFEKQENFLKKGGEEICLNYPIDEVLPIQVKYPRRIGTVTEYIRLNFNNIEKSVYGGTEAKVGEVRNYGGVDKQKQSDGTWMRYYGNELRSGKMNEENYHKNVISVKTSKVKELLKNAPNKNIETVKNILSNFFIKEQNQEIHEHHDTEVINKLIRDKIISGSPVHTNLSKYFSRNVVPAKKVESEIIETKRQIPEGMKTAPVSSLSVNDKIKVKMSFGELDGIVRSVNHENATLTVLIPSKRATVNGVSLNKVLSKYEDGEEVMILSDKDDIAHKNKLLKTSTPKKKIIGVDLADEDDDIIKIEGDEDLAEEAKRIGTSQVKYDEDDKPKINVEIGENEQVFDPDSMDDDYVSDLIDDEDADIKDINDFKLSPHFLELKNKKDKKVINQAFQIFKTHKILNGHLETLSKIIN